jgi:hypothetical protein
MIRLLVVVTMLAFATAAQAGIYRCTISKASDGLSDQSQEALNGLTKQFNPIVLNTETGFVRFGSGRAGHQWTVNQSGEAFGEQQGSGDWVFVGPTTVNQIIRFRLGNKPDSAGRTADKQPRFSYYVYGMFFAGRCVELR